MYIYIYIYTYIYGYIYLYILDFATLWRFKSIYIPALLP